MVFIFIDIDKVQTADESDWGKVANKSSFESAQRVDTDSIYNSRKNGHPKTTEANQLIWEPTNYLRYIEPTNPIVNLKKIEREEDVEGFIFLYCIFYFFLSGLFKWSQSRWPADFHFLIAFFFSLSLSILSLLAKGRKKEGRDKAHTWDAADRFKDARRNIFFYVLLRPTNVAWWISIPRHGQRERERETRQFFCPSAFLSHFLIAGNSPKVVKL